uniref:Endonuclease-reverse transcriptase n=1 Tax=Panagrellus redivivus TaxID=6233 RepID=A0A7E4VQJ6_PANRE
MPTVLYGCETWALTKSAETRLRSGQRRLERCLLKLRLLDEVSAKRIREKTRLTDWVEAARRRKWRYAKKVSSFEDDRWTRHLTYYTPKAKRPLGRPRTRWADSLNKFLKNKYDNDTADWKDFVVNDDWKELEGHYIQGGQI